MCVIRKLAVLLIVFFCFNLMQGQEISRETNLFLGYNYSVQNPFGFKIGFITSKKLPGTYFSLNIGSPNFNLNNDYKSNNNFDFLPKDRSYQVVDKQRLESYELIVGLNNELFDKFYIHYGIGYGKYFRQIKLNSYFLNDAIDKTYWVTDESVSVSGLSSEIGFMYKYNKFIFSLSSSNIKFEKFDYKIGINYVFNKISKKIPSRVYYY